MKKWSMTIFSVIYYAVDGKKHLYDNVTYQTTTTKKNGNVTKVESKEKGRQRVYRNTYSRAHCGRSFSRSA